MSTLDKAAVADIRAKVNDALSGTHLPQPQLDKLEKVWADLAGDKDAPAPPSAAANAKHK